MTIMLVDRVIDALRAGTAELDPVVGGLTDAQLEGPSAAAEWDVSQVLSHLGSGAVIGLAGLEAAVTGKPSPGMPFNEEVWARWNAMSPEERREGYLSANAALLAWWGALDDTAKRDVTTDLGFLPVPVDLGTAARFRLNEFALHSWDVRVAVDPGAVVEPAAAPLLLDHMAFMFGRIAKLDRWQQGPTTVLVTVADAGRTFGLTLGEGGGLGEAPESPDATLTITAQAWLRLVTGRLSPRFSQAGVDVEGAVDLDGLRSVFPGY